MGEESVADSILVEVIISIAVSVGGGTILGYFLSVRSRKAQEKTDIKKIQELLSDDFERISKLVNNDIIEFITKLKSISDDDKWLTQLAGDRVLLARYTSELRNPYDFAFWKAIMIGSNFIKLKPNEIKNIQATYNMIIRMTQDIEVSGKKLTRELVDLSVNESDIEKRKLEIKGSTASFIANSLGRCKVLYDGLQSLKIKWIKIDTLSESKIKEVVEILEMRDDLLSKAKDFVK